VYSVRTKINFHNNLLVVIKVTAAMKSSSSSMVLLHVSQVPYRNNFGNMNYKMNTQWSDV